MASAAISLEPILRSSGASAEAQEFDAAGAAASKASIRAKAVRRRAAAFNYRHRAANQEFHIALPNHPDNGDEARYSNFIGNYSKGLAHDRLEK